MTAGESINKGLAGTIELSRSWEATAMFHSDHQSTLSSLPMTYCTEPDHEKGDHMILTPDGPPFFSFLLFINSVLAYKYIMGII
jgi:hypothetical protein